MKKTIIYLALVLAVSACKKGSAFDNELPDTRISLESINLTGEDRLRSVVELSWFGSDVDGYVTGFELSFDNTNWEFTERFDSTFNFSLPIGSDTSDIEFYVRSIDNDQGVDPSPAYLRIPIRNTAPMAIHDTVSVIKDTNYIVTTAFFDVEDLDGQDNLDSVYIKVNNGPWYDLPFDTRIVTLVPTDPTANGNVDAQVLVGGAATPMTENIQGLNLNGDNVMYLRARDIAGSDSEIDTSKTFFVANQTSDLLVVKAHASGGTVTPEDVLIPNIDAVYNGGFDFADLYTNDGYNQPLLWNPTFALTLSFYDKVVWYSGAGEDEFGVLELASAPVQEFLNDGGKLMVTTGFPSTFDNTSVVLEFTPVDSISTSPGQARLPTGNQVYPLPAFSNYDTLAASEFIAGSTPIYVKPTAESMFKGDIVITGSWVGPDDFGARSTNINNQTNVVFFSIELHKLDGMAGGLQTLFDQVLNNEFNW